jgi:hypothetical protein
MKFLCFLFLLVFGPLFAQNAGSTLLYTDTDEFTTQPNGLYNAIIDNFFAYSIYRNPDGSKTFVFSVVKCLEALPGASLGAVFLQGSLKLDYGNNCKPFSQSAAITLAPVQEAIHDFLNDSSDVPHHIVYKKSLMRSESTDPVEPRTTPPPPVIPANPQMTILDNYSTDRILKLDLTTFAIVNQVLLPSQAPAVFAVRPSAAGATDEVWTAPATTAIAISISDLGAGKMIASIPSPSPDPTKNQAVGIVFTNDGATALYAVSYTTPDSAGNNGAVLVIDAVNRKLTSTLPLKFAPQTILMAPDGLTAYLIGSGKLSYYDVLSGTADLTVPFSFFSGQIFVHPDGTRLFWDAGQLEVFDLTTRKITNEFKFGLPSTSGTSMQMSQDGSKVYVGNGLGAVVILDTRYGNVLGTFQSPGPAQVFGGPDAN